MALGMMTNCSIEIFTFRCNIVNTFYLNIVLKHTFSKQREAMSCFSTQSCLGAEIQILQYSTNTQGDGEIIVTVVNGTSL